MFSFENEANDEYLHLLFRGFEEFGGHGGLTLVEAFERVMEYAKEKYAFGKVDGRHAIIFSGWPGLPRSPSRDPIVSDIADELGARKDLMLMAVEGRIKEYAAVPDAAFLELQRRALGTVGERDARATPEPSYTHYVTNIYGDTGSLTIDCGSLKEAFAVMMGQLGCFYYFERQGDALVLVVDGGELLHVEGLIEGRLRSRNPDDDAARSEILAQAAAHTWGGYWRIVAYDDIGALTEAAG